MQCEETLVKPLLSIDFLQLFALHEFELRKSIAKICNKVPRPVIKLVYSYGCKFSVVSKIYTLASYVHIALVNQLIAIAKTKVYRVGYCYRKQPSSSHAHHNLLLQIALI